MHDRCFLCADANFPWCWSSWWSRSARSACRSSTNHLKTIKIQSQMNLPDFLFHSKFRPNPGITIQFPVHGRRGPPLLSVLLLSGANPLHPLKTGKQVDDNEGKRIGKKEKRDKYYSHDHVIMPFKILINTTLKIDWYVQLWTLEMH